MISMTKRQKIYHQSADGNWYNFTITLAPLGQRLLLNDTGAYIAQWNNSATKVFTDYERSGKDSLAQFCTLLENSSFSYELCSLLNQLHIPIDQSLLPHSSLYNLHIVLQNV